jgi:hypothetical protein
VSEHQSGAAGEGAGKVKPQWRIPTATKRRFDRAASEGGWAPGELVALLLRRYAELSGWRRAWMRGEVTDKEAFVLIREEMGEAGKKRRK